MLFNRQRTQLNIKMEGKFREIPLEQEDPRGYIEDRDPRAIGDYRIKLIYFFLSIKSDR